MNKLILVFCLMCGSSALAATEYGYLKGQVTQIWSDPLVDENNVTVNMTITHSGSIALPKIGEYAFKISRTEPCYDMVKLAVSSNVDFRINAHFDEERTVVSVPGNKAPNSCAILKR